MRVILFCLLLLWPSSLLATPTTADFFALIAAKDFAGVEAALTNADDTGEALAQRGLFDFFRNSHPTITEFTAAWLAAEPDNPYALTARGWQQFGWGWALRGEDFPRKLRREAIQRMRALHNEALDLFTQASNAAPDLLAASDGLLVLAKTLGNIEIIPVELERIMARHPNRHTLMTAMMALAPQWGGRMEQVDLLCARYAPLITTIADYSADICRVDAGYTASFAIGPARDAAHTALQTMTHPVLDDARRVDALNPEAPPNQRLRILEKLMRNGQLDAEAAAAYDEALTLSMGLMVVDQIEYRKALPIDVAKALTNVTYDPLNPKTVNRYIWLLREDQIRNNRPVDDGALQAILEPLVKANPFSGQAWANLGQIKLQEGDLAGVKAASAYYDNAIFFSNNSRAMAEAAVQARVWLVLLRPSLSELTDISLLTAAELAEMDQQVHCPLLRHVMMAALMCMEESIDLENCAKGFVNVEPMVLRLLEAQTRGACTYSMDMTVLGYSDPTLLP